jgi:glycosyltransferase involved in cell wall biosynthesis
MNMPNQTPKIAIITRTKNRNLLLERAIKSVQTQTFKDYVHVILNDGGDRDELELLLTKYPDSNRVVIHNKKSVGITVALNQAIRAIDSKYISILDDDDSWSPDRVAIVVAYLESSTNPGAIVVMDRIVEKIENNKIVEISRNRWLEGVELVSLYKQCLDNYLSNGVFNYTRKVYEELGGYDENLDVAEDWDFGIRYMLRYDVDFINTDYALMYYHHRPEQTGSSGNSVFAGVDLHKRSLNILKNKYLREDLSTGKLGVGYIMNNLAYEQERENIVEQKGMERVVRLEGHINYQAEEIRKAIEQMSIGVTNSRLISKATRFIKSIGK